MAEATTQEDETPQEQYLFLYRYKADDDGRIYSHLDYFRNGIEAAQYFKKTRPPYIEGISLLECPKGKWVTIGQERTFYPATLSEYKRLLDERLLPFKGRRS